VDADLKTLNLLENMKRTNSNDESIDFQDEESFDGSYDDDECEDENTGELAGGTEDSDKKILRAWQSYQSVQGHLLIASFKPLHVLSTAPPRQRRTERKSLPLHLVLF
jgi:hypothetical protein